MNACRSDVSLSFAFEAAESLLVFSYLVRKELKRHEAAKFQILGFVNDPHAAAAHLLDYAVMRDRLTDHWSKILIPCKGQVNERLGAGGVSKELLLKNRHFTH